jgi:hypothetical protein
MSFQLSVSPKVYIMEQASTIRLCSADVAIGGSTLIAGFDRFLVALPRSGDLLLFAKHLFIAAMVAIAAAGQG